ncbi:hypothetical protein M409DRAFT_28009 [Zasmidium cellare ATCC 36951]|uniref:Uncharacterized protein n=1 Tax=Zasmidium cellare ATCC 36951 TaxID=1080233 RepID=A0A6A6C3M2_ZASCE|nr:uncharacterized protein M409DRAFT_28009 [Zasmidium cellare ATCC 36951]KAF2161615.1 hypothetical protein M409DRAFT_28009 [Zasmidium cellare ATCC 36951]
MSTHHPGSDGDGAEETLTSTSAEPAGPEKRPTSDDEPYTPNVASLQQGVSMPEEESANPIDRISLKSEDVVGQQQDVGPSLQQVLRWIQDYIALQQKTTGHGSRTSVATETPPLSPPLYPPPSKHVHRRQDGLPGRPSHAIRGVIGDRQPRSHQLLEEFVPTTHLVYRSSKGCSGTGTAMTVQSLDFTSSAHTETYGLPYSTFKQDDENGRKTAHVQSTKLPQSLRRELRSGWVHIVQEEWDFDLYMDFTSYFVAVSSSFDNDFVVKWGEEPVNRSDWQRVIEKCEDGVVVLNLSHRDDSKLLSQSSKHSETNNIEAMKDRIRKLVSGRFANEAHSRNFTQSSKPQSGLCDTDAGISLEEYAQRLERSCDAWEWLPPPERSTSNDSNWSEAKPDYTFAFALTALVEQLVDFQRPAGLQGSGTRLLTAVADVFESLSSSKPFGRQEEFEICRTVDTCAPLFGLAIEMERNGYERRQFRERSVDEPQILSDLCNIVSTVLEELKETIQHPSVRNVESLSIPALRQLRQVYDLLLGAIQKNIAHHESVGLDGLVALLFSSLVHKPIHGADDIMDVYRDHMNTLDTSARLGEPSLGPLSRLRYFKYELSAFDALLWQQLEVLEKMVDGLYLQLGLPDFIPRDSSYGDGVVKALHAGEYQYSGALRTLARCLETTSERLQMVPVWTAEIGHMRDECRARLDEVQDWRSNAAVVFTVVTVLFLPLSFVSSVFGMNTADVRQMPSTQWAFWASAIPFTLLVAALTLYWVDVPPLRRWWMRWRGLEGG